MTLDETDVAIVGPGPYGLSLAAQLRARGVSYRIFGPPMKFWRDMPLGINLKSFAFATNLTVPERGFTFPEWCRSQALEDHEPCTMQSFATYGLFIKDRFVPDLEPAPVTNVLGPGRGFEITLATGNGFARAASSSRPDSPTLRTSRPSCAILGPSWRATRSTIPTTPASPGRRSRSSAPVPLRSKPPRSLTSRERGRACWCATPKWSFTAA